MTVRLGASLFVENCYLLLVACLVVGDCCCFIRWPTSVGQTCKFFGVSNVSCLLVFYANFLVSLDKLSVRLNDGT